MLEHMAYLVFSEEREACWRDFLHFEVDGIEYQLASGTIRNNLSKLRRQGKIEVAYRSIDSYYTLLGYSIQKSSSKMMMTLHPARVYKRDLATLIEKMAFDTPAAHDIHLRFKCSMIWSTLSVLTSSTSAASSSSSSSIMTPSHAHAASDASLGSPVPQILSTRPVSKDIVLPEMALDTGIKGRVTVHKSDTASVILSCSESPVKFDIGGLVGLSSSLARIEERLILQIDRAQQRQKQQMRTPLSQSSFAANSAAKSAVLIPQSEQKCMNKGILIVPNYSSWTVTMWHIGCDSLERYAGEKFEVSWEDFTGEWIRVYSKDLVAAASSVKRREAKKKKKESIIRLERQEYPNDRLHFAVEQKLSSLGIASHSSLCGGGCGHKADSASVCA